MNNKKFSDKGDKSDDPWRRNRNPRGSWEGFRLSALFENLGGGSRGNACNQLPSKERLDGFFSNQFKMPGMSSPADLAAPRLPFRSVIEIDLDNILDSPTSPMSHQGRIWPQHGKSTDENKVEEQNIQEPKTEKFSCHASFFVKDSGEFNLIGTGKLTVIVGLENSFDEILFLGPNKETICEHKIYMWNILELGKEGDVPYAKWRAAVDFTCLPRELPVLKELKVEVATEEILSEFSKVYSEAIEKSRKIAFSCSHM